MNTYASIKKFRTPKKTSSATRYTLLALSCALACYLILHPYIAPGSVQTALSGCFYKLIPALFPFLCISGVLIRSGFGDICAKILGMPFSVLTGLCEEGASAYLLGSVCGFPVGGKTALRLYDTGKADGRSCLLLCALCNNPGPGFIICGVGAGLWGSSTFGVFLYILNIFSAYAVLLLSKPFIPRSSDAEKRSSVEPQNGISHDYSILSVLSESVSDAAVSMLKICGFVVFFSLIISGTENLLASVPGCELICAVIAALLEISAGAEFAGELFASGALNRKICMSLTCFAVGFGGISAHMQLISFIGKRNVSAAGYVALKLAQGMLAGLLGYAVMSAAM